MADKKSPAAGWPIIQGDYHTGDANSPVAVITMGSHLDETAICAAGAALAGSCKTENLGIEKVVANIISNPNIRFVLLCGTEVKGHLTGQSWVAMHENGVEGGKIVGSKGAIPFLENLTAEHIKRFQEQIELVNIMETEDLGQISAKIAELTARDPGAFGADPIVVQISDDEGGSEEAVAGEEEPLTGEMALITSRIKAIQMMVTDIGYRNRFASGVYGGKVEGVMIGLILSLLVFGALVGVQVI
ncbi:MAG TPA: tetrahydromethanopterin S-methyltransferase subunit A [Methanocorpusculum sp.]|jgi:tetrahydromethanopterin S-methyltransferase subunit A|nr:tetrahydromethanopterin S-methyltransferase subunit A [Methanocorpusculum sp.]MBR4285600.1 tetrahydromethanopterin S-methyltransferase subunit A [Methanocorpusculum sp.]MBR5451261.1 tetrahydromethanopterin S-methyltransferase subunit A [Methanocorpusculum sp.]HJJ61249.1 tetrahydromethanopterin S-methyltransferase subunit A [Methanocorpusculum sp.]HJJ65453.1 tetrahydromethanopterin S-methyltransferase subunit A [Methanocorpusculum sp.]